MTTGWFLTYHDVPELVQRWLAGWACAIRSAGLATSPTRLAAPGPAALDWSARIAVQLDAVLPRCADPGMAIANLERFMAAVPRIEIDARRAGGEAAARPRSCSRSSAPASI